MSVPFQLSFTVYTDPLCCWSWAFEPELVKIKEALSGKATWVTCMGGLIPSWNNYHDEVNSVTKPIQMGPVWMHAAQVANTTINHALWIKDPPLSSYPPCIAVKSAQLISERLGEALLSLLRKAAMKDGRNISRPDVIMEVAENLAATEPTFDIKRFIRVYNEGEGQKAFKADLEQVQLRRITRFPTLLVKGSDNKMIMISGYRSHSDVLQTLAKAFPEINSN